MPPVAAMEPTCDVAVALTVRALLPLRVAEASGVVAVVVMVRALRLFVSPLCARILVLSILPQSLLQRCRPRLLLLSPSPPLALPRHGLLLRHQRKRERLLPNPQLLLMSLEK